MNTSTMPDKRTAKLTPAELKTLKQYRKQFDTEVSCAISLGLDRTVLNRTLLTGSGHPDTIEKIRTKLNSLEG